jgi:hypothetical protein
MALGSGSQQSPIALRFFAIARPFLRKLFVGLIVRLRGWIGSDSLDGDRQAITRDKKVRPIVAAADAMSRFGEKRLEIEFKGACIEAMRLELLDEIAVGIVHGCGHFAQDSPSRSHARRISRLQILWVKCLIGSETLEQIECHVRASSS